jgi:alkanesulfonate monooxygenase SsuD/methylene tetrahydromethanopterin reductase-like flavin-dependent oxidoreductase (luciferase family)
VGIKLGMFTMPFHDPGRDYTAVLEEDREAIVLADRLGFSEVFVGEHFTSWTERVSSPLIFLSSVIDRTRRVCFGTGVLNLPQTHPLIAAAEVAMFDHLCRGRFIMGIGPGGLASDMEVFGLPSADLRSQMLLESIDIVLRLWSQDPPYDIPGRFWHISLGDAVWPEFKVGWVPRPYQTPHPPIALSLVTPNSPSARIAGTRGWIPISGNFFNRRYLRGHWEQYAEGCEQAGRRPDPAVWRVARCVLVTDTDAEAWDYLADPDNGLSYYYRFFRHSFSESRQALFMLKPDPEMSDDATTVDVIKRAQVIAGSPGHVLDQLVALREEIGHFGTLLMTGHEWDRPALWRRSMELLARDVMPRLGAHADATPDRRG